MAAILILGSVQNSGAGQPPMTEVPRPAPIIKDVGSEVEGSEQARLAHKVAKGEPPVRIER